MTKLSLKYSGEIKKIKVESRSDGYSYVLKVSDHGGRYYGYAWYRFTFDGVDLKGFTNLIINLGYIDDVHEAYLNETLISFKGSFPPDYYTTYDALNEYPLPEHIINREGKM